MKRLAAAAFGTMTALGAVAGCTRAVHVGTLVGPPLTIDFGDAGDASGSGSSDASSDHEGGSPSSPVVATFIDLMAKSAPVTVRSCEEVVIVIVEGKGESFGKALAVNDTLVVRGRQSFDVRGTGLAVAAVVSIAPKEACAASDSKPTHVVVHGATTPELTWAKGAMHAALDVEASLSPEAYVGRLRGTAAVAEHSHEGNWEILSAVNAAGTFTLAGVPSRLGPRQIVVVPPGVKHAWTPDPGSTLVAVQMYAPPGPEQRFKALSAPDASAPRK